MWVGTHWSHIAVLCLQNHALNDANTNFVYTQSHERPAKNADWPSKWKECCHVLSCFVAGKEYVCVLRLHDAIASETKLAQVGVVCFRVKVWCEGREKT